MVNPDDSPPGAAFAANQTLPAPGLLYDAAPQLVYDDRMSALRTAFERSLRNLSSGTVAVNARAALLDALVRDLWAESLALHPILGSGLAILAVGGYGRNELFPFSDVDLLFLLAPQVPEHAVAEPIGLLNQKLWDAGIRVSPMTRTLAECSRFDPENVEFTLALLDARKLAGDASLASRLMERALPRLIARDRKKITSRLLEVTRARHARFGDTIFHLEPNVKECPGGLRDAHCCAWLERLAEASTTVPSAAILPREAPEFREARQFMVLVRAFLHLRHGRDDNTLEWESQDEAAAAPLGLSTSSIDPSYWMRVYFRHARAIERRIAQSIYDASLATARPGPAAKLPGHLPFVAASARGAPAPAPFELRHGRIHLAQHGGDTYAQPEHDPDVVFGLFSAIARTGIGLSRLAESRLEDALPRLSANLEDGPALWLHLRQILTKPFAGRALRAMHALGVLELVIPEFHGIDALVIRDAYHRYTVDEHTFVLIDTLHALNPAPPAGLSPPIHSNRDALPVDPWAIRFASILRDLPHPELLFLAALLHDTGKGHSSSGHALESARLAQSVLGRLELDPYEAGLVLDLIRNHLEMSAALRRDVFDAETIRSFAARVPTPEALRMLTLFTFADITAVHPDALTPWKAENLWRLYTATASFLDRNVDDERLDAAADSELGEVMHRVHALLPNRRAELAHFLDGLPRRYLQTRTPDQIRAHFEMALQLAKPEAQPEAHQVDFRYAPGLSELTLITRDRPRLFASMAGALAAWGMNIVTADAFSNAHGLVVDSFRFTDTFRSLELNQSERARFVDNLHDVLSGRVDVETLLIARRRLPTRARRIRVETRIHFDGSASTHSTLLQVVAQDTPGLLRALSLSIALAGCNIEVALIDTEGEMAIDVFYLTYASAKLESTLEQLLARTLLEAIEANAR